MLCSPEAHSTGIDAALADGLPQSIDDVLHRQRALGEKLLEQRIVAFGNHFHQRLVRGFRGIGKIGGNFALFALAIAIGRVGEVAFMRTRSTMPLNSFSEPMGIVTGTAARPNTLCTLSRVALEIGAVAIEPIDDDGARAG